MALFSTQNETVYKISHPTSPNCDCIVSNNISIFLISSRKREFHHDFSSQTRTDQKNNYGISIVVLSGKRFTNA